MIIKDRLSFLDQCVAGDKTRFQSLLSIKVFDDFDWGYRIYRDYIRQKSKVTDISCDIDDEKLSIHLETVTTMEELLSENFPKKGIVPVKTESGVDLNINLIDSII